MSFGGSDQVGHLEGPSTADFGEMSRPQNPHCLLTHSCRQLLKSCESSLHGDAAAVKGPFSLCQAAHESILGPPPASNEQMLLDHLYTEYRTRVDSSAPHEFGARYAVTLARLIAFLTVADRSVLYPRAFSPFREPPTKGCPCIWCSACRAVLK